MMNIKSKYIGGEFSSGDLKKIMKSSEYLEYKHVFPPKLQNRKLTYFESGADSIAAILNYIKVNQVDLWIPYNFCHETIERVQRKLPDFKINSRKYDFIKNIPFETDGLVQVILLNYYNFFDSNLFSSFDQSQRRIIIEDFTHAPLQINKTRANFSFASLRKFLPISASITYGVNDSQETATEESAFLQIKKTAARIKDSVLIDSSFANESLYIDLFKLAESQLQNPIIQRAHLGEIEALQRIDLIALRTVRKANYQFLQKMLNQGELLEKIIPGEYMYFMCKVKDHSETRRIFFENGIFPAIHWQGSAENVLSFHIDQRYEIDDMKRIIAVFNKAN